MTMLAKTTETRALTLADYEARIHLYKEQIGTGYIGIGRTLLEAKEAKVVPHGQWEQWVTETTGLTPRQAQRCMQAATEIKDGSAMARLEMSKALMLLGSGLDEEAREEIAEKAGEEGATVKALKEEIRQAKMKLVQETGAATEMRLQLEQTRRERDSLTEQMKAQISGYQKRMDEEREDGYRRGVQDGKADAIAEAREAAREQADKRIAEMHETIQRKIERNAHLINERDRALGDLEERDAEIAELKAALLTAEKAGSDRWDDGFRRGSEQGAEDAKLRITGLQNELNGQKQYVEDLRRALDEAKEKGGRDDREILLAAAEEAEKRAADAEAELEALKAAGAGQPDQAWKILKKAVDIFMSDCEMLPISDIQGLMREEEKVRGALNYMEAWIKATRGAMASAVEAEGAVV